MIFLSQRPNDDPYPWLVIGDGWEQRLSDRWDNESKHSPTFDPREEYDHTNDPSPWIVSPWPGEPDVWAPRREEFDTPVNNILARFRYIASKTQSSIKIIAEFWLIMGIVSNYSAASNEEKEHAKKVLTLLAIIK